MHVPGLCIADDVDDLPWKTTNVAGVQWLPIHLQEGSEGSARSEPSAQRDASCVLIRMAPGASYGAHRHLGPESVLVLRGGYRDAEGEYTTGACVHYPTGSSHAPRALGDPDQPTSAKNPACVLYAVACGGIELLGRES